MTKILEIDSCWDCYKHFFRDSKDDCLVTNYLLGEIPKNCPLCNKPEPITEDMIVDMLYTRRIGTKRTTQIINVHFLGEKYDTR